MWIFPAVGMGLSSSRKQLFPAGSTYVHVLLKWSTSCLNQIIQSAYTAWSSNHYWNEMGVTMMFQCIMQLEYTCTVRLSCDVTMFWNLIGTANFLAAEVTVWIRRSCQAISPTAWEIGMRPLKCFLTSTRAEAGVAGLAWPPVASFPGSRINSVATSQSSSCTQM